MRIHQCTYELFFSALAEVRGGSREHGVASAMGLDKQMCSCASLSVATDMFLFVCFVNTFLGGVIIIF